MAPLRSLMDLFQRGANKSLWRRGQWSFVRSVFTWPQRAANRETLLGFLGFGTASPEEEARGLALQENLRLPSGSGTGGSGILMSSAGTQASATGSSMVSS